MAQVFEEFQLAVCSFRQDRSTEGFHDLLDRNGLASELVFCGAVCLGEHMIGSS